VTQQQQQTTDNLQWHESPDDEQYHRLRAAHPRLAGYLDMTIQPRRLWEGGYDLLGQTYATRDEALDAQRAAIKEKLIAAGEGTS
jgi:hypothetical protein